MIGKNDVFLWSMKWIKNILLLLCWVQLPICAQIISDAEIFFERGEDLYDINDFIGAKQSYRQALDILEKSNATNTLLYYQALEELADLAAEEEDYYAAVRYMEQAVAVNNDTVKRAVAEDDGVYTPYRKLSDFYAKAGLWDKAFSLKQQRLIQKWQERHNGNFDIALEDYMHWVENANFYKFAYRILRNLHEKYGDDSYYNYWMGECYYHLRDYDKALVCFEKANNYFGIAKVFAVKGDIAKAINIQEKIVGDDKKDRGHRIYISGHAPYEKNVSVLASYYIKNGEYDKAISCEEQNKMSVFPFLNLGRAYAGKKQWNQAIDYAAKAYSLKQQESGMIMTLADLSRYSFMANNISSLRKYTSELVVCAGTELLSAFQELTYDERSRYIEEYSDILNRQIPMYAYYTHSDSIIAAAYNASLVMKGALLNSENSVKSVIDGSKDASLKDLWEEMRADRYILRKELEKDSLSRKISVDSLQRTIYRLEDSLIVKCKEYGDITHSMKLKWNNIQQHLLPNDIAIEFLSLPINNDCIVYVALSLRRDSKCPKMIPLFEEKQLKQVSDTVYYQCKEMANLVWKPLLSELQGVKNIYFAPSGALYNIGIEYLPGMEDYNIYRLSSTREIVQEHEERTNNNAVLYGGLNYNAVIDTTNAPKSLAILDETFKERAEVKDLGMRGGKEYLKHTKIEIDRIGEELNKANWVCLLDTASAGTEESFKALSGRKVSCLHVSTHGFYYTKEEADNAGYRFMLFDDDKISAEDKALTRSGLLMSGANHLLEGEDLPDNVEDGILTAKEIADVDLRGLDLVVLSACQTGLGDIAQSEGVFGLQRGFKKAGANSILMSLWKVDDEATQILMTQFYKNWLSGQSKRQALLSAQKYLRETEGGKYNEPEYWAAFILLDGIK